MHRDEPGRRNADDPGEKRHAEEHQHGFTQRVHLSGREREGIACSRFRHAPEQPEAGRNDESGEHEARRYQKNAVSPEYAGQMDLSSGARG